MAEAMTKREVCEELTCQGIFGYGLADAEPIEREVCRDVVKDIFAALRVPSEAMVVAGDITGIEWEERHDDDTSRGMDYDMETIWRAMIDAAGK